MDGVSAAGQHLQLELALHLTDGERPVQIVDAGQEQQLGHSDVEELLAEALEPALPVLFRLGQVDAPGVLFDAGGGGG